MPDIDTITLLQIGAVINGGMAVVWCLLAGMFRIAPRAAWIFAAVHVCALLTGLGESFLALPFASPAWMHRAVAVVAVALLAAGVRRLMRKTTQLHDIAAIGSICVGLTVYVGLASGSAPLPIALSAIGLCLLSLTCCRDLAIGAAPHLSRAQTLGLILPFLGMAVISSGRVLSASGFVEIPWYGSGVGVGPAVVWFWIMFSLGVPISLIAVVISRLIQRIEQLTLSDTLTGLSNRRALSEALTQLARQQQRQHSYGVLMIDVDHFKHINDTHGHAAGDAALQHLAGVLKRCTRQVDVLGRLGGEEFCVLLPRTDLSACCQVAERMRAQVENDPLIWRGLSIVMTISVGVATGMPDDPDGEGCLSEADAQMYRAKAQGRNRVCAPPFASTDKSAPAGDGA
jgi:diguanylate cyclase (GGDEF)-like protein